MKRAQILIVDDEALNLMILEDALIAQYDVIRRTPRYVAALARRLQHQASLPAHPGNGDHRRRIRQPFRPD